MFIAEQVNVLTLILKRVKPLTKPTTRILQACWILHWYYGRLLLSKCLARDPLFGLKKYLIMQCQTKDLELEDEILFCSYYIID